MYACLIDLVLDILLLFCVEFAVAGLFTSVAVCCLLDVCLCCLSLVLWRVYCVDIQFIYGGLFAGLLDALLYGVYLLCVLFVDYVLIAWVVCMGIWL